MWNTDWTVLNKVSFYVFYYANSTNIDDMRLVFKENLFSLEVQ